MLLFSLNHGFKVVSRRPSVLLHLMYNLVVSDDQGLNVVFSETKYFVA